MRIKTAVDMGNVSITDSLYLFAVTADMRITARNIVDIKTKPMLVIPFHCYIDHCLIMFISSSSDMHTGETVFLSSQYIEKI